MNCGFFGHRNTDSSIKYELTNAIISLIENNNVDTFYVGNQGKFDLLVAKVLQELKATYPQINYYIVLAYLPTKSVTGTLSETIFPEGLEKVPPRFAITKRNLWIINNSDYIITYVTNSVGGAAHFKELSIKKNKTVIEISDTQT